MYVLNISVFVYVIDCFILPFSSRLEIVASFKSDMMLEDSMENPFDVTFLRGINVWKN